MHQIIYALVEAQTRDDALAAGKTAFDRLVGAGPEDAAVLNRPHSESQTGSNIPMFKYQTETNQERIDG